MTQKEKLMRAQRLAIMVKSQATILRQEARSYDCIWPIGIAENLERYANDFLKIN